MASQLALSENIKADTLFRAKSIYTLEKILPTQRSLAIKGGFIWAVSEKVHGLDIYIGPDTRVLDEPNGTVLPSFNDTHTHLIFAGLSAFDVPVHDASTLDELLNLIRKRAQETPSGKWIVTAANFQEYNLREKKAAYASRTRSGEPKSPNHRPAGWTQPCCQFLRDEVGRGHC